MCMSLYLVSFHSHNFLHISIHHSRFQHLNHAVNHLSTGLRSELHLRECKYHIHLLYHLAIHLRRYHHPHGKTYPFRGLYYSATHLVRNNIKLKSIFFTTIFLFLPSYLAPSGHFYSPYPSRIFPFHSPS